MSGNANWWFEKILVILVFTIPFQEFTASYPFRGSGQPKTEDSKVLRNSNLTINNQTEAEDRKFLKPPTFPYWGPFGLTGTALFCAYYVGPFAGSWNRACAGPVPPFQQETTTTTTPKPNITNPVYGYGNYPPPRFPGPYPPPKGLSFPYDNSFYPLPGNVLAINAKRRAL
ncbi:unnamed protein product [Allacma fusca]|uniref:Uncharacterized protein n=1 Tax=Allacma fusca TaxID=39272 RepID=A0A8J2KNL0_9HEXA|nr:unnamed protein product [Allacma fusca]